MGGKNLKFPKRKKFVAPEKEKNHVFEGQKEITDQEHEARMKTLRDLGLVK